MTDDELTEALRRMMQSRAGRLRPAPGHPPGPGEMPAPTPRPDPWFRRPRTLVALAAAAVVVAAAATAAAVTGSHTHSPAVRTRTATAPTVTVTPPPAPTVAPTTTTPPTTAAPTTTTTVPAVPAGFVPLSVTFVSASTGWTLGDTPCRTGRCAVLARTTDGGATWSPVAAPTLGTTLTAGSVNVRFADGRDGWIYTSDRLWSTHDGGATWQPQPVPGGQGASIGDLEASAGVAYMVVFRPGTGGEGIYSTPAGADTWTASPLAPGFGAGPVPHAQIVLQGPTGWILTVNRVVVSGARNLSGAGWEAWTPPCSKANGPASLAAASGTDLVAWCDEGVWGPPDPGTATGQTWLWRSSDGGSTFSRVATIPAPSVPALSAAPGQPLVLVAATPGRILRSSDGGASWSTVYQVSGGSLAASYVGFTTATQAIAVVGDSLLMSRDGGATWSPARF